MLIFLLTCHICHAQDFDLIELEDPNDLELLKDSEQVESEQKATDIEMSEREELDDLESLKEDIGEVYFDSPDNVEKTTQKPLGSSLEQRFNELDKEEKSVELHPRFYPH